MSRLGCMVLAIGLSFHASAALADEFWDSIGSTNPQQQQQQGHKDRGPDFDSWIGKATMTKRGDKVVINAPNGTVLASGVNSGFVDEQGGRIGLGRDTYLRLDDGTKLRIQQGMFGRIQRVDVY